MKQMWLLTAVLMVGVLAGGYFALVSPKKGEVTKLEGQTTAQRKDNSALEADIKRLQSQAKSLPAKQARLAELHKNMPSNPALPALVRSLTKSGDDTGMFLEILEPAAPVFIEGAAAPEGKTGAAAPASAGRLAMVPIKVTAWGSFAEAEEFFSEIEKHKRTLMVTNAEIGYFAPADDDDNPCEGCLKVVIEARVFMRSLAPKAAVAKPAKSKASTSSATDE